MRAYYERALKLEPQMLINTLVKQITLYDDKIIIQYNSPIKAGPDESRDFSFYEKTTQNALCKAKQEGTTISQVYDCAFRLIYKNSYSKSWQGSNRCFSTNCHPCVNFEMR